MCPFIFAPALALSQPRNAAPDSTAVAQVADSVATQPAPDGPRLDFGKITEYDFGKIEEKGGKQTYEFAFSNSGSKPLVITKAIVSCKCVDIVYPKKPVMPGEKGKIAVTYNPRKQKGVFLKTIQVYSNDPRNRQIVIVKGEVQE